MLALSITNSWGFRYRNPVTPTAATLDGVQVTPGTSDAEGAFTEIVPDASVTTDIYYAKITVMAGTTPGQSKQHLLDFAWDPTGGTTYDQILFSNYACGGSSDLSNGLTPGGIHFPCKIPAGSAIAVRVQGSNATPGVVRVVPELFGKPSRPELWRPAAYSETLGYTSGTLGTSFTPGTDAHGTWASLGTTTKRHFWAQLGVQCNQATTAAGQVGVMQLGIGAGAVGDTHVIASATIYTDTNERYNLSAQSPCTWEIPAGAELWVRGALSSTPDSGWNATAVLFGG